jgi:predicted transcriptional regulator
VTNIIDQHRGILAALGERFITYRMPSVTDYEKNKRADRAMANESTEEQEKALTQAARQILSLDPSPSSLSKSQRLAIVKIVQVVAKARTEVLRDKYSKSKEPDIPMAEHPGRLAKQLGDLAVGIAMVREQSRITQDIISLIQHIALHTITLKRIYLFRVLLKFYPKWVGIDDVAEEMGFSDTSVSRWFQDLLLLKLVERRVVYRGIHIVKTHEFRLLQGQMLKRVLSI